MINPLKNHPFAVDAHFQYSVVLTFAVPADRLEKLIPECLELDTFQNKWAFVAVAMVQTKDLRPSGFPKILGCNFFLTGYRIFVKHVNSKGKRLRGLYIIKSETDQKSMHLLGNIFTHYNYTTTDINLKNTAGQLNIKSNRSNFHVSITQANDASLPVNSPFENWKEARRFAGPMPFTFTYNQHKREVTTIEGVRKNWKPEPVVVNDYHFAFLDDMAIGEPVLASAFTTTNIPYHWKKGTTEIWKS